VLRLHKQRHSSLPDDRKRALLEAPRMVDAVVMRTGLEPGIGFRDYFLRLRPCVAGRTRTGGEH